MNIRKRRIVAAMACFGLIAGACGDDDDDATDAPGTSAGGDTGTTGGDTGTTGGDTGTTTGESVDPASIEFDIGVDDETIKVGLLADLSGAFAPLVTEITEAQRVYWDKVNEEGGIAGRQIELV
ncbi:MAG: ABC transporter substrate-binding protein, partial [Actinomycetota bacterium]|nr:ABC transporter substrate-binding protein [Actinomycetota bacterium]